MSLTDIQTKTYSTLDLGFDLNLTKPDLILAPSGPTPNLQSVLDTPSPSSVPTGEQTSILFNGKLSFTDTTAGFRMGVDTDGTFKFYMGDATTSFLWDGATLTITGALTATSGSIGGFSIGADYIRDAANSMGLASTVTGGDDVRFWAGAAFASRATAPFRVTEAGAVTGSSITITGGSVSGVPISSIPNSTATDISLLEFTHNLVFTVTDADTIAWGSGTINLSNGRTFSISAGNTGNMAALTYIYLDPGTSSTVLQTTTTYSTAIGANKILVAAAKNNTVTAAVIVYGGGQLPLVDGQQIGTASILTGNIAANTIVAGNIAANTITAAKIAAATITTTEIAATTITGSNIATLNISGKNATFDTGTIGGFSMSATQLTATNFSVTSGAANTARLEVGSGSNVGGINSGNGASDIAFWAGDTFANRASAPFRVDMAGNVTMTSATISGVLLTTSLQSYGTSSVSLVSFTNGPLVTGTSYAKYKAATVNVAGTYQYNGQAKGGGAGSTISVQTYVNGVPTGNIFTEATGSFTTFALLTTTVAKGDSVELWAKVNSGTGQLQSGIFVGGVVAPTATLVTDV